MTELRHRLATLQMRATARLLDDLVATATKKRLGPIQLLEYVVDLEESERNKRSLERRTKRARLPKFKLMADFEWQWPSKVDRALIESVVALDFVEHAMNVVLVAPPGLGKTMIAQNIVHEAVLAGLSARFITASDLLLDLAAQDSPRTLERRLRYYAAFTVLAIDEVGFLPHGGRHADLLYQLINRCYGKRSLVVTTNLAFAEWGSIFPNATCVTAIVERLIHRAEIVPLDGDSYRAAEAERETKRRQVARAAKAASARKR